MSDKSDETETVGSIYRSEIFCTSEEQRRVAEETIADVDASGYWLGKTVTKISGRGVEADDREAAAAAAGSG